jgi:hypothetical protein|tara:strand:- start:4284 stop:4748 length:465 start_codon:yes stop_codon:yes gene_type:complete
MKITKQQLKQIIKEELEATLDESGYFDPNREPGEGYPYDPPFPGIRGAVKDFFANGEGLAGMPEEQKRRYQAAWKAIGKKLHSGNVSDFIRAVEKPGTTPDHIRAIALKLVQSMDANKLKVVRSLENVVSLMGSEGQRRGHTIGSDFDPGYVRE